MAENENTFLDEMMRAPVVPQRDDVAPQHVRADLDAILLAATIQSDLKHVIAKGVGEQVIAALLELVKDGVQDVNGATQQQALYDSAAKLVQAQALHVGRAHSTHSFTET